MLLEALAEDFRQDVLRGDKLIKAVGPWIAILGSSTTKQSTAGYRCVYRCGELIVKRLGLPVGTGASSGCMDAGNHGAWDQGGISVGIYPAGLPTEQQHNPWCTHFLECKTLLARQHLLLAGACGVIIGPEGGMGTVFELGHQIIEMRRKQFDPKTPIVIVDHVGVWAGLQTWLAKEIVARGLWKAEEFEQIHFCKTAEEAIEHLASRLQIPEVPDRQPVFAGTRPHMVF